MRRWSLSTKTSMNLSPVRRITRTRLPLRTLVCVCLRFIGIHLLDGGDHLPHEFCCDPFCPVRPGLGSRLSHKFRYEGAIIATHQVGNIESHPLNFTNRGRGHLQEDVVSFTIDREASNTLLTCK